MIRYYLYLQNLKRKTMELNETIQPWRTPYNATMFPKHAETNNLPSMTVPDQSFTVLELLYRHAAGLPLGAPKIESYDGGEDPLNGQDFSKMDLADQQSIREAHADYLKTLGDQYQQTVQQIKLATARKIHEKTTQSPSKEGDNNTDQNTD